MEEEKKIGKNKKKIEEKWKKNDGKKEGGRKIRRKMSLHSFRRKENITEVVFQPSRR